MINIEYNQVDAIQLTEQEEWVLEKVEKGEVVDLSIEFGPDPMCRCLQGRFLQDLVAERFNNLKVHYHGILIKDALITGTFDLEDAIIPHPVAFRNCIFKDIVIFKDTHFKRNLSMRRSNFLENVNSNRIKVDGHIFCVNSVFKSSVDFSEANIKGRFDANGARFEDKFHTANFNLLTVSQSAYFQEVFFKGPVDFGGANIGLQFIAFKAIFNSVAVFYGIRVLDSAVFSEAIFEGKVVFSGGNIGKQFQAFKCYFNNKKEKVSFNALTVGDVMILKEAVFMGPVDLRGADIGKQLMADGAEFHNENKAHLCFLRVGDIAFLRGLFFKNGACINDASFGTLLLKGTNDINNSIAELDLERTNVVRDLEIENVRIGNLKANNLRVNGQVILRDIVIKEEADLRDSSFHNLKLVRITWPKKKESVVFDGLTYHSIIAGEGETKKKELINLLENSRFNLENYNTLENNFQRIGYKDWADEIYIKGKRRELWLRKFYHPGKWATLLFWDWLSGYGRKPGQIFRLILPLILLGTIIFAPEFEPKFLETHDYLRQFILYHPWITKFILSLDRFLPGVDLGLAKYWQPSNICLFTYIYWYVLKIFGWIMIPIFLAAIYTKIK